MFSVTVVPHALAAKDGEVANESKETVAPTAASSQTLCPGLGSYGDETLNRLHVTLELNGYAPSPLRYVGEKKVCKWKVLGWGVGCQQMSVYRFTQLAFDAQSGYCATEKLEVCTPDQGKKTVLVREQRED